MQARKLRALLNDTKYTVANYGEYIAIGSAYCHDLIKVMKDDFKMTYALDTFRKGRAALSDRYSPNEELLFIWDKVASMIESGEMKEIIDQDDVIENPLPVFWCEYGDFKQSVTDTYEWPNFTAEGFRIYENTHFRTKEEAIDYGIKSLNYNIESLDERFEEKKEEVKQLYQKIATWNKKRSDLERLLQTVTNEAIQNMV